MHRQPAKGGQNGSDVLQSKDGLLESCERGLTDSTTLVDIFTAYTLLYFVFFRFMQSILASSVK